jgi:hypothetical protein
MRPHPLSAQGTLTRDIEAAKPPPYRTIGRKGQVRAPVMTSTYQLLENLSPRAAAYLTRYFDEIDDGSFSNRKDLDLNLLAPLAATQLTATFHSFHPVIRELGGVIIDDPGTSDHHVFLSKPPLEGTVLFLAHDDDTRVVFSTLGDFLSAATAAKQQHKLLTDFHPPLSPVIADQVGLGAFVRHALADRSLNDVIVTLIPCLDLRDLALLEQLVDYEDFFLGEAVAMEISKRPSAELRVIADLCARHPHPQVANAGRLAISATVQL